MINRRDIVSIFFTSYTWNQKSQVCLTSTEVCFWRESEIPKCSSSRDSATEQASANIRHTFINQTRAREPNAVRTLNNINGPVTKHINNSDLGWRVTWFSSGVTGSSRRSTIKSTGGTSVFLKSNSAASRVITCWNSNNHILVSMMLMGAE